MGNISFSMAARTGDNDAGCSKSGGMSRQDDTDEKRRECLEKENTVLVVDDDEIFLKAVKNFLKRRVSSVLTASSPAAALSILGRASVNVLVCDFDLGREDVNGVELVGLIRKKFPSVKRAVICSASSQSEIPLSPYIDDILDKTTDLEKLRLFVQKPL